MPDVTVFDFEQSATLWPSTGYDSYGAFTVGDPIVVPCRWVWSHSEAVDAKGNNVTLDATVNVEDVVAVGSRMQLVGDADQSILEVKTLQWTPDLKARFSRVQLGLMRYRDVG